MSKIGLHCVVGPRNGYGAFLARLRDTGSTLAVVKCVGDFGAAFGAKQYLDSRALTTGRIISVDGIDLQGLDSFAERNVDPVEVAGWYHNLVRPMWESNRSIIDVWECFNEWSAWWEYQADVLIALMDIAEADGFRLGLFGTSTGNPPDSAYPALARACRRAAVSGGHVMCVHEYGGVGPGMPITLRGTEPHHALRYRRLYDYLRSAAAVCPLIISEAGQDGGCCFIGTDAFISDFAWYDSELMRDDYVIGATAWTLGHWEDANLQEALPALADYIVSHPNKPPRHDVYLPLISRGNDKAPMAFSPGGVAVALALGAGARLLERRMRKVRRR